MSLDVQGNQALKPLIRGLAAELIGHGAWFDPHVQIHCASGDIAVRSSEQFLRPRTVLQVPLKAMPMVEDFHWSVRRQDGQPRLIADAKSAAVDPLHCSVMSKMVDIYNRANKLESWMVESPWFSLEEESALLEALLQTRANAPKFKKFAELRRDGDEERLLIDSFLGARVFNLKAAHCLAAGWADADKAEQVLLPVIDYCNHRFSAEGFSIGNNAEPPNMRIIGKPETDTGEVYVRYKLLDAVDAYLSYGFVDTDSPYLGSKPMTLSVEGVELHVLGTGGIAKRPLPASLRDLRLFMPKIQRHESSSRLTLSSLLFPGPSAPRALQRVLAAILKGLDVKKSSISSAVAGAERQLIEENEGHWQDLRRTAGHLSESHPAIVLCKHCLAHIDQYKKIRPPIIS